MPTTQCIMQWYVTYITLVALYKCTHSKSCLQCFTTSQISDISEKQNFFFMFVNTISPPLASRALILHGWCQSFFVCLCSIQTSVGWFIRIYQDFTQLHRFPAGTPTSFVSMVTSMTHLVYILSLSLHPRVNCMVSCSAVEVFLKTEVPQ